MPLMTVSECACPKSPPRDKAALVRRKAPLFLILAPRTAFAVHLHHPFSHHKHQVHHLRFSSSEQRYQPCLQQGRRVHRAEDSCHHGHRSQERLRCQVWCSFRGCSEGVRQVFLRQHRHRREVGRNAWSYNLHRV